MKYIIAEDNGNPTIVLTTDSPQSHYGMPVLRYEEHDCKDFGPADIIPNFHDMQIFETEDSVNAGSIIFSWANSRKLTLEEREAARLFLSQWPDAPFKLAAESWFVENKYYEKNIDWGC